MLIIAVRLPALSIQDFLKLYSWLYGHGGFCNDVSINLAAKIAICVSHGEVDTIPKLTYAAAFPSKKHMLLHCTEVED